MLLYAIIATLAVTAIALVGILVFSKNTQNKNKWMKRFIGLATGTLLAAVFFDLLPEAIESLDDTRKALLIVLASILAFFFIEKAIHYHHCTCEDEEKRHNKTHLIVNNLIGDGLHNFIDGTIIASAFLIDVRLGIGTTIAVALHEIPQEISDFSILVYAGLGRAKATVYNVLFGLTSVLGAVLVFALAKSTEQLVPILLAIAAGNFIYLAMADLIPELHHEDNPKRIWTQAVWVGIGIILVYAVTNLG
ncbi:ZIP zinc transporter [bacterium]|jgi:zinc and cadmium transporter|nr:ZIP zinc transporter [bacterium]MDP6571396.1 ZIP family metal transporter [Patescibacteria group bacterium]|tara:strand:+ start:1099 stop:1845 length:747 start_codon:yes stop_codon:yes gene_type:complete